MSASQQKKLRKNQAAEVQQQMTERQQEELKQQRKVKRMTGLFFAGIILVAVLIVCSLVWNSGLLHRNITAVSVEDYNFSAAQVNYAYIDTVNSAMNDDSSYLPYFVSTSTPLDQQECVLTSDGSTWADYFLDSAIAGLEDIVGLCKTAEAEGYTLTEEDQATIDETLETVEYYATLYGYSNVNKYLRAYYGNYANLDTYKEYITMQQLASSYQTKVLGELEASYTDEDITAYVNEHATDLTTYTYRQFTCSVSTLGGLDAASDAAEEMVKRGEGNEEMFLDLTLEYCGEDNTETYEDESATLKEYLGMNMSEGDITDWVTDPARQEGDIASFPISNTSTEGEETITGYNVVYFKSANDNTYALANVRHILIQPEGGTYDSDTGETTYTDEEWAAADAAATELYNTWKEGDATEESFIELVAENSDDTGSNENGGLYEDVYPGQMVDAFNDWCFAEDRKAGDTGIIKTDYGYHIMYYVGDSDTSYAEYMGKSQMYNEDAEAWYAEVTDGYTATQHSFGMKLVNTGLTLSSN